MRGFILAAGLGTRLRPLTDVLPKPLVLVAGVPLLRRAIGQLTDAGVREIGLNTFHLGVQIADFVGDGATFGVQATVFNEAPAILGTGGGLKNAEGFLRGGGDAFVLANGDVWHGFDLRALLAAHRPDALATLAVFRAPYRPELHQVFIRDVGDCRGEVAHIRGAPQQTPSDYAVIYSGVGVFSARLLDLLPGGGVEACLVRQGLVPGMAQGLRVDTVELSGAWFDCGTRAEVLRASAYALRSRAAAVVT